MPEAVKRPPSAMMLANRAAAATCMETRLHSAMQHMSTQSAPWFSPRKEYPKAKLDDVADMMSTGDLLCYHGPLYNPVSGANECITYSPWSHIGGVIREGYDPGELFVGDCCVKTGCSRHSLREAVAADPGRWFWSHVARRRFPEFDEAGYLAAFEADEGRSYGFMGIALQFAMNAPIGREVSYVLSLDRLKMWSGQPPFCSWGKIRWTRGGGCDPVLDRPAQMIPPRDVAASPFWSPHKIALVI